MNCEQISTVELTPKVQNSVAQSLLEYLPSSVQHDQEGHEGDADTSDRPDPTERVIWQPILWHRC